MELEFRKARRYLVIFFACFGIFGNNTEARAVSVQVFPMRLITVYYAYTAFGGGDVVFRVANNSDITNCEDGFWIQASSPGFEQAYSALISSYFAGKPVAIVGDSAYRWPGSNGAYCRVDAVGAQ